MSYTVVSSRVSPSFEVLVEIDMFSVRHALLEVVSSTALRLAAVKL